MEEETKEVWKEIPEYNGDYHVSNLGRVISFKRGGMKFLKLNINSSGRHNVNLLKDNIQRTRKVAQLVAIAFLGHVPCGHKIVVDHIDNDKLNDRLDNLQLISQRENASKDRKGSSQFVGVSWHKARKKWHANIWLETKVKPLGFFTNEKEASDAYQKALKQHLNK